MNVARAVPLKRLRLDFEGAADLNRPFSYSLAICSSYVDRRFLIRTSVSPTEADGQPLGRTDESRPNDVGRFGRRYSSLSFGSYERRYSKKPTAFVRHSAKAGSMI